MWLATAALAVTTGVVFLPVGGVAVAGVALLAAGAGFAALLLWWSPVVRVVEPAAGAGWWLQAGDARIPVSALASPVALSAGELRTALGPQLDARSHRCVRGWVPTGVRVDVADDRDATPYWLVSCRRPEDLVAALARAGTATSAGR